MSYATDPEEISARCIACEETQDDGWECPFLHDERACHQADADDATYERSVG